MPFADKTEQDIYYKNYYLKNKNRIKLRSKKHRENNKESIKKYKQHYFKNNQDVIKTYCSKNKDKITLQKRKSRERNYIRSIFNNAKARARKMNIDFNIEIDDIIIPKICPVLNIEILSIPANTKAAHNSASIDRIDNTKGYVKGNIRIISFRANCLKSDATLNEIKMIYNDLLKIEDNKP